MVLLFLRKSGRPYLSTNFQFRETLPPQEKPFKLREQSKKKVSQPIGQVLLWPIWTTKRTRSLSMKVWLLNLTMSFCNLIRSLNKLSIRISSELSWRNFRNKNLTILFLLVQTTLLLFWNSWPLLANIRIRSKRRINKKGLLIAIRPLFCWTLLWAGWKLEDWIISPLRWTCLSTLLSLFIKQRDLLNLLPK